MLAERRDPSHEYYVAVLNDRATGGPVLVASAQGGMNIEEVAAKDPNAIITTPINFEKGLSKQDALAVAQKLGFKGEAAQDEAADIFINLYKIFKEKDATQIEINPMAETADGHVLWFVTCQYLCSYISLRMSLAWMRSSASTIMLSSARRMSSASETYPKKNLLRLRHKRRT